MNNRATVILLLAICSSSICLGAWAEMSGDEDRTEHQFYLGGLVGQARGSVGDSEMNSRMAELGYEAQAQVSNQNRFAWGLNLGYQWTPYLAFEAGYLDLGEVRTRLSGLSSDMTAYLNSANQVHPRSISGYELAIVGRYPLSERLDLFARGGALRGSSKYRAEAANGSASRSDRESDFGLGIGMAYALNDEWSLNAQWRQYEVEGEDIDLLGFGFAYRFSLFGKQQRAQPAGPKVQPEIVAPEPADNDGDGVADGVDNCPDTMPNVVVDHRGCPADGDKDGIADAFDDCPETTADLKVDAKGCPVLEEAVSIELEILFASDSAAIEPAYYGEIRRVADFLERYPRTVAIIEGHTDSRGSADYNKRLSQRRADAVALVLVRDLGVDQDRVEAIGYGEEQLLEEGNSPSAHEANRRVIASISTPDGQP